MEIAKEKVWKELLNKNPSALEYLMDTYGRNVYGLIHRILKDIGKKEDIEECVSDVVVEIWNHPEKYNKEKGTIKTWILVIAKYKALDYRRKLYDDLKGSIL